MPGSFYYPACKVRIQVRLRPEVPEVVNPVVDPFVPGAPEAFGAGLSSQLVDLRGDSFSFDVVPLDCSVELNSYRMADTASMSIDFRHLPIDPRIIRSATIQVFGGVYWPDEFAQAMAPDSYGIQIPDVIQLPNPRAGLSNEIFRGFADTWTVKTATDGTSMVSIEARDMTGPLIDAEADPAMLRDIPADFPLDAVLQLLLTGDGAPTKAASRRWGFPGFRGMLVVNESGPGRTPEPLPPLSQIAPPTWFTSKGTFAKGRRKKSGRNGGSKVSVWDMITDIVTMAGLVCFIRQPTQSISVGGVQVAPAAELVLATPETYYDDDPNTTIDDRRLFVYGNNVEAFTVEQQLQGPKRPSVEVAARDALSGELLTARFPPTPKKNRAPPGTGDREEIKRINHGPVSGPQAMPYLLSVARSVYEQLGRGELSLEIDTRVLSAQVANHGEGLVADLFQLRPRDPIELVFASENFAGSMPSYCLFAQGDPSTQTRMMIDAGFPVTVAARIALAMSSPFLTTVFRCAGMEARWTSDRGWDMMVRGISFLDVRDSAKGLAG